MESYIQISKINDFIFCPRSIYFHAVYEQFHQKVYHQSPQLVGKIKHENIEEGEYSTAKRYLQGMEVYSEKYGLAGKIDIYDQEQKSLIERKTKVVNIYDGYRYQLYAQMFALQEMGYSVEKLFIHSLTDNKRYPIDLPEGDELERFEDLIEQIRSFEVSKFPVIDNEQKCNNCIYRALCH